MEIMPTILENSDKIDVDALGIGSRLGSAPRVPENIVDNAEGHFTSDGGVTYGCVAAVGKEVRKIRPTMLTSRDTGDPSTGMASPMAALTR